MGKSQKRTRLIRAVSSPYSTAQSKSQEIQSSENEQNITIRIKDLLEKITNNEISNNDKVIALSSMTVMCNDSRLREEFMKQGIMGIIFANNNSTFLINSNLDIVNQTLELLKVITFEDGYSIATHFWKKRKVWNYLENILNNLKTSFNQLSSNSEEFNQSQKQLLFELTENLFGFIVALTNASENILEEILSEKANNEKMNSINEFVINLLKWAIANDSIENENDNNSKSLKITLKLFNTILDLIYMFCSESEDYIEALVFKFGFSLPQLVNYGTSMSSKLNSISKIYIESIKFQVFEVVGIQLALNNNEIDQDEAIKQFEIQREEIFMEIFQNLVGFLNDSMCSLPEIIKNNKIDFSNKNQDASIFMENYKKKTAAQDELQAMEISLDLIATMIEYSGTNPDLQELKDVEEIIIYFNNNKLINCFINETFLNTLFNYFNNFDLKFELHSWDCFINISILFNALPLKDLPNLWKSQSLKICQLLTNPQSSCFFKTLPDNFDNSLLYHLQSHSKALTFLNTLPSGILTEVKEVDITDLVKFLQKNTEHYLQIQVAHSKNKKKQLSMEVKEFQQLMPVYYQEFVQFLINLAKLPSVSINELTGGYILYLLSTQFVEFLEPELVIDIISGIFTIYGDKSFVYDEPNFKNKGYSQQLKNVNIFLKTDYFKRKIDKNLKPELKALSASAVKELERFIKYKDNE